MNPFKSFLTGAGGLFASSLVRGWMGSLEYKAAMYDPAADMASPRRLGENIYVLWHEYLLLPLYLRGNCHTRLLISRHRDAEILSRAAYHLGFELVRGSSGRNGPGALRELLRRRRMNVALTSDGPLGPRRVLASGPIYLAAKLEMPLVVTGIGFDHPWRINSWDRFAIPRPCSRARAVLSPAITVPRDLERDQLEIFRSGIERLLNRLTLEAEAWAESGTAKAEEIPVRRGPAPSAIYAWGSRGAMQRRAA